MDKQIAEDAAILTGLGLGATFAILVIFMAVMWLLGWGAGRLQRRDAHKAASAAATGSEAHDKALAAAIAVSALLPRPTHPPHLPGAGG